jgi:ribosomal protein S18 acetylase RimI-like enzyme
MLAAPISLTPGLQNGPRPIDLRHDSKQVIALLDTVFGPLMDSQGRRRIGDRVSLNYGPPLITKLSVATPRFVPGFVWEQEGQIVANLSLVKSQLPGRYLIANVAVHPDFRRRGYARILMEEAIQHVKLRNGREIHLQVREENVGATLLYENLGFTGIGSVKQWLATSARIRLPAGYSRLDKDIRPLRKREWRMAFKLDSTSVDPDLMWPTPPNSDKYHKGLTRWFDDFFKGRKRETWVKEITPGEGKRPVMAGLVNFWSEWGRGMKLELRVHPELKGSIESDLLAKALTRITTWRSGSIRIRHPANDELTNRLLSDLNFNERLTLLVMKLTLL